MTSGIYKITCLSNGRFYIGSAVNIKRRWARHSSELNCKKHGNIHLQRSWDKYGQVNFTFDIIEECDNLIEREQYWIDTLSPEFNIAKVAGSNQGIKFSDDARRNMSEAHKGMVMSFRSEEHRKKIGDNHRGKKLSPEAIAKRTESRKGYKPSEETKAKVSASLKAALAKKRLSK